MRIPALFLLLLFIGTEPLFGQQAQASCCDPAELANQQFVAFAEEDEFRSQHTLVPFRYQASEGRRITFETPDGEMGEAYYVPARRLASNKYLIVIHEWWGLNDHIQREADVFADSMPDVHIMAVDLYDGKVATTREKAGEYSQGVQQARAEAILRGAMTLAGEDAEIATVGWCFGGGWSLQAALLADDRAAGCVMYYGMPIDDVERLEELDCEVLGIFAKKDGWITPKVVAKFEENMEEADQPLEVLMYDADHAFANPSSPRYEAEAAEAADARALAFLRQHFD